MGFNLLLAPKNVKDYTPEEFLNWTKTLVLKPENNSPVDDIVMHLGTKVVIRCSRKPKSVTEKEIEILAAHHKKEVGYIKELFKMRKFIITNQ